jgi:hypothetical protein
MITDPKQMQKMVDFARIAKQNGFSQEQVEEELNKKGSSLMEVGEFLQMGIKPEEPRDMASGVAHSALKGATAGLSPKLIAGSEALADVGPYNFMQNRSLEQAIASKNAYQNAIDQKYEPALDKEIERQAVFEQEHPIASFTADMAGGFVLPVGVAAKTAKTTLEAIKSGSKVGAVIGALRGLNETRGDITDKAINTAIGGAVGGVTGGALAPVTRLAGSAISKSAQRLANTVERARLKKIVDAQPEKLTSGQKKVLRNVLGSDERVNAVIEQAKGKGVTLAELGNDNINRVLQAAEMVSPDARITISDYKENFERELPGMAQKKLDSVLKTESGMKSIPEMQAYYNAKAKPLYDQANATKVPVELLRPDNPDGLYGNTLIKNAADEATKNYAQTFGGRGQVKVDDLQFWDGVKRVLDDKIEVATRAGEKNVARNLMAAKNELVSKLDELSPVYKQARSVASNTPAVEKAEGVAEKIFNSNITPENLSRQMGEMTPAELDAVKIGVRNKIINLMDTKIDPSTGFSKLLPKQAQENLKVLLGENNANELIAFAKRVHSVKNALYAAKGGSQTGARITQADELNQGAKDAMSVKSIGSGVNLLVRKATDKATRASNNKTFNDLANLILYGKYPQPKPVSSNKYVPKILESLGKGLEKSGKYIYRLPPKSSGTINERLNQALKVQ